MIKLDNSKHEKDKLIELIKLAKTRPTYELEAIIGNSNYNSLNTETDFINIIKRIKGKKPFTNSTVSDNLLIYFDDSKYKDIDRVIIKGSGINQYCNSEDIKSILSSVNFEKKRRANNDHRVELSNYGVKFNLKEETQIGREDPVITELLHNWNKIPKSFRLKKTYHFQHDDDDFRIDLSIVSQSFSKETVGYVLEHRLTNNVIKPKAVKEQFSIWWESVSKNLDNTVELYNSHKYYKTLKESRVLENTNYQYEFEVEWLGNKTPVKLDTPTETRNYLIQTIKKFLLQITYIKQAITGTLFVLSKTEMLDVVKEADRLANCGKKPTGGLRYFPLAINLERKNMPKLAMNKYKTEFSNIRMNYVVTDKADGARNLLFINSEGSAYFISREGRIAYAGFKFADYSNSILDGEYITEDIDGKSVMLFGIFDAYVIKGQDITGSPFGLEKEATGRHIHIKRFNTQFNKAKSENVIYEDMKYKVSVFSKQYYAGDTWKVGSKDPKKDTSIFEASQKVLKKMNVKYGGLLEVGHQFSYPTDGLIYLPVYLSVKQDSPGNDVNSIDGRWNSNLKWKPSSHNTIDLMVKFNRDADGPKIAYDRDNRYLVTSLHSKIFKRQQEYENILAYRLVNEGINYNNLSEDYPFVPIYPFMGMRDSSGNLVDTTSTAKLPYVNNTIKCQNGDIIADGSIVEFGYNTEELDPAHRWVAHKVRFEKDSANAIHSAFQVWDLINNPITTEMIIGEEDVGDAGIYYLANKIRKTKALNKFNNFVKQQVIQRALENKTKTKVLDLACGKFGDMSKYIASGVSSFVGIDIAPDNLLNKDDGAPVRLIGTAKKNDYIGSGARKLMDKTMFIIGNASKNLMSGEAGSDELSRYYLDILYGHQKPPNSNGGKLQSMYGSGLSKFHLVVCNFAIHYMMNSQEDFHSFLLNVKQNLKDQCYFIATCYDGPSLINKVKSKGGKVAREVDGSLIYSIDIEDVDEVPGYGNKVDFYFETFYQTSQENLVNIEFLEKEFAKFDLKLVDSKLFDEEPDSMFNEYMTVNAVNHGIISDEPVFRELAGMQRWMIFQKVDGLGDE